VLAGDAQAVRDAFDQVGGDDPFTVVFNLADSALAEPLDLGGDAALTRPASEDPWRSRGTWQPLATPADITALIEPPAFVLSAR
jgi:hypothetical protein